MPHTKSVAGQDMHSFAELADRSVAFTLGALNDANERVVEALQSSGATSLVKTLQAIQLQEAILAVGVFSMFEAWLQDAFGWNEPFKELRTLLGTLGKSDTRDRFDDVNAAINVLKHGRGPSYDKLAAKTSGLPFRVKPYGETLRFEGDVSEIRTLVEVDDAFVMHCCAVINEVSQLVQMTCPPKSGPRRS